MNPVSLLLRTRKGRIAAIALSIVALDQITKAVMCHFFNYLEEKEVIPGFFRLVLWHNTGAAWSMFHGRNAILAGVALLALVILYFTRHHFDARSGFGQVAFGLIIGGIVGNLIDRLFRHYVVDFLYFYLQQRGGEERGFPAFNVADSAICTGVGLVFLVTWRSDRHLDSAPAAK